MPDARSRRRMKEPAGRPPADGRHEVTGQQAQELYRRRFAGKLDHGWRSDTELRHILDAPESSADDILRAGWSSNPAIRARVAADERLPWSSAKRFLRDSSPTVVAAVLTRSDCNDRTRKRFTGHESEVVRSAVASTLGNPVIIDRMLDDPSDNVLDAMMENPSAPDDFRAFRVMGKEEW